MVRQEIIKREEINLEQEETLVDRTVDRIRSLFVRKTRNKKGGIKELLYDNAGIIVVIVLFILTIMVYAERIIDQGEDVEAKIDELETELDTLQ